MNKNNGMNMKYTITASLLSFVALLNTSYGVQMTPQISSLLEQKNAKIAELEKCDSNRKAWMIAGISTIGLTAVGVGVNIAQASKSNKLSAEIDSAKNELKDLKTSNLQSGGGSGGQALPGGGAQIDLSKYLDEDGIGSCYYDIDGTYKRDSECSVSNPGDWGVVFSDDYTVRGIAACSDLEGTWSEVASDQGKVDSAYTNEATSSPEGRYCYCKGTNSDIAGARWVSANDFDNISDCADRCPSMCRELVLDSDFKDFRKVFFGID